MRRSELSAILVVLHGALGCGTSADPTHDPMVAGAASSSPTPDTGGQNGEIAGKSGLSGEQATAGNGGVAGGAAVAGGGAVGAAGTASAGAPSQPIPIGETPEAKWVNVTNNLAGMASECGNLGRVSAHPTLDLLIVGVAKRGLYGSRDGGASWQPLGADGAAITNRISYVAYDPVSPMTFWESGIYNGGGVYKTSDGGATFTQVGNVTHCDSVSVDFSDAGRMTLLAGSHEQALKLFRSTDGGAQWQNIGEALPADSGFCTVSTILTAKTFLVGCGGWYGGNPGIQRTIDGGDVFTQVSDVGVAGQPLRASDGAIYWAGHQAGGLYKSADQGEHFVQVAEPANARSVEPIELPDGRIVTVGGTTLMASTDGGTTWHPLADALPFTPSGVTYSAVRNAFYVWQWDCKDVVLPNAIMRFGYDYRK